MQEFRHETMPTEQHFTQAETVDNLNEAMNELQAEMEGRGFVETKRVKVGRNNLCPCGSNKKFKKCCIHKAKKTGS